MIKANTNKCFAGCSSPLLKYIDITYLSLSEVTLSLKALLRCSILLGRQVKNLILRGITASLAYLLTLKVQSN